MNIEDAARLKHLVRLRRENKNLLAQVDSLQKECAALRSAITDLKDELWLRTEPVLKMLGTEMTKEEYYEGSEAES